MTNINEIDPLFPHTEWNDYITEVNKKVITLDSDREAQYQYIMEEFHKMSGERKWDRTVIVDWYKSQMHIIGKHEMANAFDFMALYTQPVINDDTLLNLIKNGAKSEDFKSVDKCKYSLNHHWTIEDVREWIGESDVSDERCQKVLAQIIKCQKLKGIDYTK